MPITKTMAYCIGDATFLTLEGAQIRELALLLDQNSKLDISMPEFILKNKEAFIEILNCNPIEEKKPVRKPRSDKGTKRAKAEAINRALQDGKQ